MTTVSSDPSLEPDPHACPLCGRDNRCALEVERLTGLPQPPCWCTRMNIDPAILERIPVGFSRISCICPDCAAATGAGAQHSPQAG